MAISNAVPQDALASTVGYELLAEQPFNPAANLPQRMVVLAEASTANQTGLPKTFTATSAKEVADITGYGCPAYMVASHLFPLNGGGGVTFPVEFQIQETDAGATATTTTITTTVTTITGNAEHFVKINGRSNFNGKVISYIVTTTDTDETIATKIQNAIASVIYSPISAAVNGVTASQVDVTTLWKGGTSAGLSIEIDTNGRDVGVSYAIGVNVAGAGSVDLSALDFGETWNTIVLNTYGESQFTALENYNGNVLLKTGRYDPLIWKPFLAIAGTSLSNKTSLLAITDTATRKPEMTNEFAIAPNSPSWDFEIAAVGAREFGNISHNEPHLDIKRMYLDGIIIPDDGIIGDLSSYAVRNELVKGGCSTAIIKNGKYVIDNFVTTYHPDDNPGGYFTWGRGLMIDFNVKFSEALLQNTLVEGRVIGEDDQTYSVQNIIKPSAFKQAMFSMIDGLAEKALIQNPEYSKDNLIIEVNSLNKDRFDTVFPYNESGFVRIISNSAKKVTISAQ